MLNEICKSAESDGSISRKARQKKRDHAKAAQKRSNTAKTEKRHPKAKYSERIRFWCFLAFSFSFHQGSKKGTQKTLLVKRKIDETLWSLGFLIHSQSGSVARDLTPCKHGDVYEHSQVSRPSIYFSGDVDVCRGLLGHARAFRRLVISSRSFSEISALV